MGSNIPIKYEVGQQVGTCFFHKEIPFVSKTERKAEFQCGFCGAIFCTYISAVKCGNTISCGCQGSMGRVHNNFFVHGMKRTSEYNIWCGMTGRCHTETNKAYNNYGGRGIVVCERWRHSFLNFLADMGKRPSRGHSLDRYPNNDGNYEPSNCRWATRKQQQRNTRKSVYVEYMGVVKSLPEWCEELGLNYGIVRQRIRRDKVTAERAFTNEIIRHKK